MISASIKFMFMIDSMLEFVVDTIGKGMIQESVREFSHSSRVLVHGSGTMARMLRRVLAVFAATDIELTQFFNSTPCMPEVHILEPVFYTNFLFFVKIILMLCICESYLCRLRYVICSAFYPEVAKAKVVFFYRKILDGRVQYGREIKKMARKLYRANMMAKTHDPVTGWWNLICRKGFRCLICKATAIKTRKSDPMCPQCELTLCEQCWAEAKFVCPVCTVGDDSDGELLSSSEYEN